jgi:hypothetical protein
MLAGRSMLAQGKTRQRACSPPERLAPGSAASDDTGPTA